MPVHRRLLRGGRHVLGHIGGALKQPRPRYEPWQNQMVDPSHGGGQFGASGGVGGEALMLSALPGMGYKQFFKSGLSMTRQLSKQQLLRQAQRRLRVRDPSMYGPVRPRTENVVRDYSRMLRPQYGGRRGSRFRQEYRRAGTSLGDLEREYLRTIR